MPLLRVSFKLRLERRQLSKRRIRIRRFLALFVPVLPVAVVTRSMSTLPLMALMALVALMPLVALVIGALICAMPPSISATRRSWRITGILLGDRRLLTFGGDSGGWCTRIG